MRKAIGVFAGALIFSTTVFAAAGGVANAAVKKAYVASNGSGGACSQALPCSITTAVATAASGTKILLADGTYDAQLTVTTSNLTIQGISKAHEGAVVLRPGPTTLGVNETKIDGTTGVEAVIGVSAGTTGVAISNLTIDGSQADLPACSGTSFAGVEFLDASGSVSHVHVAHMQPASGITGCQVGDAIYVGSISGNATVKIASTVVDSYNKNGITCKGAGTSCTITSSTVTGTPTAAIAQNGIQFSAAAGGSIANTNVYNNTNLSDCHCASGILLYQAGQGISISDSKVKSSDNNIYALGDVDGGAGNLFGLSITGTSATNSTFADGLTLDSVDSATISGDKFTGNAGNGIGGYGVVRSLISNTTTSKNVGSGIYFDGSGSFVSVATGNVVTDSTAKGNHGPGIWAAAVATSNTFSGNGMQHNSPDARDDNAVNDNSWAGNSCVTSNPSTGLCS